MLRSISNPEINFIIVKHGTRDNTITISIHEIQPSEDILKKETVDYFLKNPKDIFTKEITITKSDDPKFRYYVCDGNNRLFVLYQLGINELEIVPDYEPRFCIDYDEKNENIANDTFNHGVITWEQLKKRIVPKNKYHEIMTVR